MSVDKHIKDFAEIEQQKTLVYQIIRDIFVAFEITDAEEMGNITEAILESLDNLINFKSYISNEKRVFINDVSEKFKWNQDHVINLYLMCMLIYKNLMLQQEVNELKGK
jgi:hypothetical protein